MTKLTPVDILKSLKEQNASFVHLRNGHAPAFWKGNEPIPDRAGLAPMTSDQIKIFSVTPLTEDQIHTLRWENFIALPLRIKGLGEFFFEASAPKGELEITIYSSLQPAPELLFRQHHDLRAEAANSPDDADVYWNLAVTFIKEGEFHLAWRAFDKAKTLLPTDPTIHHEIGKVLGYDLRRVEDAIDAFEKAIALPEHCSDSHFELAVMHRSSERLPQAEAAARKGLLAFPGNALLLEALAVTLIEQEKNMEAIEVLEQSLKLHGRDPEIEELLEIARVKK